MATLLKPSNQSAPKRGPGRPSLGSEVLLDRALDLFLEYGFDGTSMDAIAARLGVAKRTLYQRFGDKQALFRTALDRAIEDWIVPIAELQALECPDFEATLIGIGRRLVGNIMQPDGLRLLRISTVESARYPEIGSHNYRKGTERTLAYLADLLARRLEHALSAQDTMEAAVTFLYLIVNGPPTMAIWGAKFDAAALDRHTEFNVRIFLRGVIGSA